jgi:hypothetical protein
MSIIPVLKRWEGTLKQRVHVLVLLMSNTIIVVATVIVTGGTLIEQVFTGILIYDTTKLIALLGYLPSGVEKRTASQTEVARSFFESITVDAHPLEAKGAMIVVLISLVIALFAHPLTVAVVLLGFTTTFERISRSLPKHT